MASGKRARNCSFTLCFGIAASWARTGLANIRAAMVTEAIIFECMRRTLSVWGMLSSWVTLTKFSLRMCAPGKEFGGRQQSRQNLLLVKLGGEVADHFAVRLESAVIPGGGQIGGAATQFVDHPGRRVGVFLAFLQPHALRCVDQIAELVHNPWMLLHDCGLETDQVHARHITDVVKVGDFRRPEVVEHLPEG